MQLGALWDFSYLSSKREHPRTKTQVMASGTAQRSHASVASLFYVLGQCPRRGHTANRCMGGTRGFVVRGLAGWATRAQTSLENAVSANIPSLLAWGSMPGPTGMPGQGTQPQQAP